MFLYNFLQSHSLTLPQTFTQLPFCKCVSYKETTCTDHLLVGNSPRDWTTLDYLMCPPSLREVLTFGGSIFQQAVNSRHLPLSFHLRTRYLPIAKTSLPPKKDYRVMADFYSAVQHSLLSSTDNSIPALPSSEHNVIAYTDGSNPNNRAVSYDNPAGWGFALVYDQPLDLHPPASAPWQCSFGPLKSNPQSVEGLSVGSNNTGELRAVIELFDFLLYHSTLLRGNSVVVYTDSQYVLDLLNGSSLPSTHPQLVNLAQQYYTALRI